MHLRGALAATAVIGSTLSAPGAVVGQTPAPAPPVRIVSSLPAPEPGKTILVGASGQLYRPVPGRAEWRRASMGGVATTVRGAIAAGEVVYAVGPSTPIYRWSAGTWHALPLANRGTTVTGGTGSVPVLAVGRHVYLLRGRTWKRVTSLNRDISAVWGASTKRVYAADAAGSLRVWTGGGWSQIRATLAGGDTVVQIVGDGSGVYARTRAGQLLALRATNARVLATPPDLGTVTPSLIAADGAGQAWVIVTTNAATGTQQSILLRTQKGGSLAKVEGLPPLAAGDRFATLRGYADGSLLVATRRGTLHVRAADGTWRRGQVSGELPPGAIRAFDAGPARSR